MKKGFVYTLFSFVVVVAPILDVYSSPIQGLGLGLLVMALCDLFIFISLLGRRRIFKSKYTTLILFLVYSIFITGFNILFFHYSMRNGIVRLIVTSFYIFSIILFSSSGFLVYKKVIRFYRIIAILVATIVLIQTLSFSIFSKTIFFVIPGLTYNQSTLSNYELYSSTYNTMYEYSFRPTSIFLEPSHAALFLCPLLLVELFTEKMTKKRFFATLLISVSIFLTTSGTGILVMAILWLLFIVKMLKGFKASIYVYAAVFIVVIISLLILPQTSLFEKIVSLLSSRIKSLGTNTESSIFVRLFKGFEFYGRLSLFEKIFGIGMGNYDSYILVNGIDDKSLSYEYMSSISYIFSNTGIIGFGFFLMFFATIWNKSTFVARREVLIVMVLLYFTGSILFSSYDFILYIFLFVPSTKFSVLKEKVNKSPLQNSFANI